MAHTISTNSHEDIVNRLTAYVLRKMPPKEGVLIENFVRQYYMSASAEDLSQRTINDLYGAVISHWQYIQNRKPGEAKVRVYNPQFEENGWQSTHTIIEISHDDVPFLVDSVRMELDKRNLTVHLILYCGGLKLRRDKDGNVTEVVGNGTTGKDIFVEAPLYLEIDRQSDPNLMKEIELGILSVLSDVRLAVTDWSKMQAKMSEVIKGVENTTSKASKEEKDETYAFLKWINDNKFTFLSYYELELVHGADGLETQVVKDSRLGVCRKHEASPPRALSALSVAARNMTLSPSMLILGKTSTQSTVHRQVYTDFVSVKIFDKDGKLTGEHRFIGLYTAEAYNETPEHIPVLRKKVEKVLGKAGITRDLHEGKVLLNIIGNLPRDDLFQATEDELYDLATGVMQLQERRKIRLFIRRDVYERFYSCLVYVPRDRFNSDLRARFQEILMRIFGGTKASFTTVFTDSVLARIHYVIWVPPGQMGELDRNGIEQKLVEASQTWEDGLNTELLEHFGEEKGNLYFHQFRNAFPAGYRAIFTPINAVYDVKHILELNDQNRLGMSFYNPLEASEGTLRFKLFQPDNALPLSDIIPMLECLGLRVISESPHEIKTSDNKVVWINDFCLVHSQGHVINAHETKGIFQDAFFNIWNRRSESDGFNRLVLSAMLNWREITLLRAYAKYMWQTGFTFTQSYVENTFVSNINIAKKIVELFKLRFDPTTSPEDKESKLGGLRQEIEACFETVVNLDEDRILRRYVDMIMGTLRTNYFQKNSDNQYNDYIAFKFDPALIPDLPLPRPLFEIFVYSPRVEGVHLRGAKVARGGLRWSDRREDFRTEVLGLMKAQQVKNSVIVPLGAKGGFYPKNLPLHGTREEYMKEAISCYQIFISALLEITDNIVDNKVIPPVDVVRYDPDDPYLVVAADKGTATFSDYANALAVSHGFWLGDAFASGGSAGYDHKKMGITAKGAWESVMRHFTEFGVDTQTQDFTVVGIGDMAGDVFGNGMLLSEHICLVGAFNHMHIFLDPTPDPKTSFQERKRMFNLPRSSWEDYNAKLISKGGGIFLRSAKSIKLTPEVKKLLGTKKESMVPNELIKALLTAEVDLLWNGGIGTYVKASYEHNLDVGDRANDGLRVNGEDLRCKVVAEGGNLGFTQLGRIEYALKKGRINTDAIDNSAGVDCSDHEVNIKILLNAVVSNGDMTPKQRNEQLASMTDEVSELVLTHNRQQNEALSYLQAFSAEDIQMHNRLIQMLEKAGDINRQLEFLPDNETMLQRKQAGQGLTRPEMAILMAYMKNILKKELLGSNLPEDPYFQKYLRLGFPKVLFDKFQSAMEKHRLKREIIATQVGNLAVNEMGMNFVLRLKEETGASPTQIICGYMVSREIFDVPNLRKQIRELDIKVNPAVQAKMLREVNRLARRGARWFLRHRRTGLDLQKTIAHFSPRVTQIAELLPNMLSGAAGKALDSLARELMAAEVPKPLAYKIASMSGMFSALDIVEAATTHKDFSLEKVLKVYFSIGVRLQLGWFREQIKEHSVGSHWDSLARAAIRDDLDRQQRSLTISILKMNSNVEDIEVNLDAWMQRHSVLVERWKYMVADLRASAQKEFTMFSVALRELVDLAQSSQSDAVVD